MLLLRLSTCSSSICKTEKASLSAVFSPIPGKYLKDSIREWKEHKRSIERKIEDTKDSERKSKLLAYLDSVNNSIELLEKEYDKQRDKTTDELNDEIKRRIDSPDFSSISNQSYVNPVGEKVPTVLDKFKQVVDKSERKEE